MDFTVTFLAFTLKFLIFRQFLAFAVAFLSCTVNSLAFTVKFLALTDNSLPSQWHSLAAQRVDSDITAKAIHCLRRQGISVWRRGKSLHAKSIFNVKYNSLSSWTTIVRFPLLCIHYTYGGPEGQAAVLHIEYSWPPQWLSSPSYWNSMPSQTIPSLLCRGIDCAAQECHCEGSLYFWATVYTTRPTYRVLPSTSSVLSTVPSKRSLHWWETQNDKILAFLNRKS